MVTPHRDLAAAVVRGWIPPLAGLKNIIPKAIAASETEAKWLTFATGAAPAAAPKIFLENT